MLKYYNFVSNIFSKSKSPSVFLRTKVRSLRGLLDAREILTNFSAQRIVKLSNSLVLKIAFISALKCGVFCRAILT